jgi:acyl carrier protein
MGLDSVELVMGVEEEFGIQIPDAEAEKFQNVGDMLAFVVREVQAREPDITEEIIWLRLREVIVDQLAVLPEEVTASAEFVRDLGLG